MDLINFHKLIYLTSLLSFLLNGIKVTEQIEENNVKANEVNDESDDNEVTIEVESEADIEREIKRSILQLQWNQKKERKREWSPRENSNTVTALSTVYESPLHAKLRVVEGGTKTKSYRVKVSCLKTPQFPLQETLVNYTVDNNETLEKLELKPMVEIVNASYLLQNLLYVNNGVKNRGTASNCTLVYFYAPWCPFSAKGAPHYNALPRAFPSLRTVALDSVLHPSINTYFGIVSVPSILLFHNGKIVSKFNDTIFTLTKFAEYIQAYTDLKSEEVLNVTSSDFKGPLPSVVKEEMDIWLFVAWIFIIFCLGHYLCESEMWRRMIELVRTTWREAEAQHEHTD